MMRAGLLPSEATFAEMCCHMHFYNYTVYCKFLSISIVTVLNLLNTYLLFSARQNGKGASVDYKQYKETIQAWTEKQADTILKST